MKFRISAKGFAGTLFFLFVLIAGVFILNMTKAPCYRCNVILISVDTLRADELPCLGYHLPTAPKLCSYAKKGALFSKAYANASWTLPVDMSVFTGLQPFSHNVGVTLRDILSPAVPTLPELFRANGYYTTFVSNAQPNVAPDTGLGRGFDTIDFKDVNGEPLTTWLTTLDAIKIQNKQGKPVFAFFHTDEVHNYKQNVSNGPFTPLDPSYKPPEIDKAIQFNEDTKKTIIDHLVFNENQQTGPAKPKEYAQWKDLIKKTVTPQELENLFTQLPHNDQRDIRSRIIMMPFEETTAENTAFKRHLYDTTIRGFDEQLNGVLDRISSLGLENRTVVLIYSEHGEFFGEHGLEGHGKILYEEEIRVPLIIRAPSIKPQTVDSLVSLVDIFPTLLEMVGLPVPADMSALSLVGLMQGKQDSRRNSHIISQNEIGQYIIRTDRWKLFVDTNNNDTSFQLFDMHNDPTESTNVSEANSDIMNELSHALNTKLQQLPVFKPIMKPFPSWLDDEHRKNLIETGYFF